MVVHECSLNEPLLCSLRFLPSRCHGPFLALCFGASSPVICPSHLKNAHSPGFRGYIESMYLSVQSTNRGKSLPRGKKSEMVTFMALGHRARYEGKVARRTSCFQGSALGGKSWGSHRAYIPPLPGKDLISCQSFN